jgi:phage gp36-like protein
MAYATQADLVPLRMTQKDLNELCVDNVPGQTPIAPNSEQGQAIVASVTAAALEEASGKVDSYCRGRYATPLQPSDDVKGLTLDIAAWLLFSRRRQIKMSEAVQARYEEAIGFLKDIAARRASLDQPATAPAAQTATAGPEISERDRHLRFDEKNIEGFV